MRPVDAQFPVSQEFGSFATAGVVGDPNGSEVQQLVAEYGNYQPYGHAGQDIACPIGTPVNAIADGTVLWADWGTNLPGDDSWSSSGYFQRWALYKTFPGIVTVIQHDGWISVYAHLSDAPLNTGDRVTEGQQIALSGNTRAPGVSLGAHLHVEALVDLTYSTGNGLIYGRTDPTPYFGGIAAMGSTITPIQEQDMPLSGADHQFILEVIDDYAKNVRPFDGNRNLIDAINQLRIDVLSTKQVAAAIPGQVLFDNRVDGRNLFDWFKQTRADVANVPANVLNQSFKLPDGTVTNLAGILTAIHAQPVAGGTASADPTAVIHALRDQLNK